MKKSDPLEEGILAEKALLAKIERTIDGMSGIREGINYVREDYHLSDKNLEIFCDNSPNGEELWEEFKRERDREGARDGYNFVDFVYSMLSEKGLL